MRHILSIFIYTIFIFTLYSCYSVPASIDIQEEESSKGSSSRLATTRSTVITREDSLKMISDIQGDIDNLMLSRVIKKDDLYILSIKREDAIFLGVDNETYDRYLDYVERLNSNTDK